MWVGQQLKNMPMNVGYQLQCFCFQRFEKENWLRSIPPLALFMVNNWSKNVEVSGECFKVEEGWKIYENLVREGIMVRRGELLFLLGLGIGVTMATMNQLMNLKCKCVQQFGYCWNFSFKWIELNFFIKVTIFSIYNYCLNSNQIWIKIIGYSQSWWSRMLLCVKRIWSEKGTFGSNQWY